MSTRTIVGLEGRGQVSSPCKLPSNWTCCALFPLSSSSRNQQSKEGCSSAPRALLASPRTKSSLVQRLSWAWATGCTRAGKALRPGSGPLRACPAFQGSGSCWGGARPSAAAASAAAAARRRFPSQQGLLSIQGSRDVFPCLPHLQPSQEPGRCSQQGGRRNGARRRGCRPKGAFARLCLPGQPALKLPSHDASRELCLAAT